MGDGGQLDALMGSVAEALLGAPNPHLSKGRDLRFGSNGSLHVNLAAGTFYDHENEAGGGVLDLISRQIGGDHRGAMDWLKERGLLNGAAPAPPLREVAQYNYVDENDNLVFQVVRFEPKTFRQRRRDETGAWSWSVKGVRQVPFGLPDLIEAIAMERTVFVVEGEKDVISLRRMGITATCNAGGVGKWQDDFAAYFAGADVVVVPDNDDVGRDHARKVAASIAGSAARVRILALPNLPPKGDVSDFIASGGTADAIRVLAERAPDWNAVAFVSRFGAQMWEDIGKAAAGLGYSWLIEDIFPFGEISLAFGDSGTGKSFNIFDLSMCVARGIKFGGRNVEQSLVIYVAAEAGKGFGKRKTAYVIEHQLESSEPLPFVLITKRPDFFHDDADVLALIVEIEAIAKRYKLPLGLIVLDTLSALAPGMNENASADVSMVRKRLVMLQEKFAASIILVHHKPKGGSTPRGHGSLTGDFETTVEYETVPRNDREGLPIHRATMRKQREGKSGVSWEFTLPVIEVGKNKWGNPETSCVVRACNAPPSKSAAGWHASPGESLFLRALFDAMVDHGQAPPTGLPRSIAKVVQTNHVRALMRERFIAPHEDNDVSDSRFRSAFKRAGDKLRDGGVIGVQGGLLWPTGKPVRGFDIGGAA